jgi:tRNA wybutosine-synthesizing protein 1
MDNQRSQEPLQNKGEKLRETLKKMHYGLVGEAGAVQVCRWTKNALRGDRGCWKEVFYGVSSAGCCEMTPNVMNCENKCLHCWRPIEFNLGVDVKDPMRPKELLEGVKSERRKLLNGFLGRKGIDKSKVLEAMEPSLYTMSLSGEPTLYPYLGELFNIIREEKRAVSFLVTNGQNPDVLRGLGEEGLPTQIAISTNASNKELFVKWHRSCNRDSWERFLESLDVLKELKGRVRRVVRLTVVKCGDGEGKNENAGGDEKYDGYNNMKDEHVEEYADLVRRGDVDFVHVKGFKSVGYSRERFGYDKQPWFLEVRDFAKRLERALDGYEVKGEDERCCVVLLAKAGSELKIDKF